MEWEWKNHDLGVAPLPCPLTMPDQVLSEGQRQFFSGVFLRSLTLCRADVQRPFRQGSLCLGIFNLELWNRPQDLNSTDTMLGVTL